MLNEIRVADSKGFTGFARDAWAATRLRSAITVDRDVQSINYNIDVVQGIVYLMGVAQDRQELNRVIETARTIPDVNQVISYVKLAGDVNQEFTPASAQTYNDGFIDEPPVMERTQTTSFQGQTLSQEEVRGHNADLDNQEPVKLYREERSEVIEMETIYPE